MPSPTYIAIVDDEQSVRRALLRLLRSARLEGHAFASGPEFLDVLADPHSQPTCAVIDLHMPGMDGFELERRLAVLRPDLPVIFITGQGSPELDARAKAARVAAFLQKPVDGQLLLDSIRSCCP